MLDARESYLSLTGLAHTTESYRRLPRGWTTTPSGYFTDQWMYLAFLGEPWVRAATTARGTALRFPSVLRREWSDQERLDELRNWSERLATPAGLASIGAETDGLVLNSAMTWRRIAHELATTLDHHQAALEEERHQASVAAEQARRDSDAAVVAHRGDAERLVAHGQRIEAERDAVAAELMSVAAALRTAQGESEASQRALRALRATRTMRARNAMLRWPLVRSLLARRS